MAELWKGAPVAAAITAELVERGEVLRARGIVPTLAIVRAGEKADDITYENAAVKRCETIGIAVRQIHLPSDVTKERLLSAVDTVNADDTIHGCLLLRPLPDREWESEILERLAPEKNMDEPPCTAQGCLELLDYYGAELKNRAVCVVGRSAVVGKPLRELLEQRGANVTVCHSKTEDLPAVCRRAEIVVSAVGKAGVITADCVSAGQTVIDVGINEMPDGKLCGDVDFDAVEPLVSAITPVPGGVGAVTTAVLCKHVIEAAERV